MMFDCVTSSYLQKRVDAVCADRPPFEVVSQEGLRLAAVDAQLDAVVHHQWLHEFPPREVYSKFSHRDLPESAQLNPEEVHR